MIRFIMILLLTVSTTCNNSAKSWLQLDKSDKNNCVSKHVIASNSEEYLVKMKVHKIENTVVEVNGEKYHQLRLDDLATLQNIGEPALPVIIQHIGLPMNSTYRVNIIEEKWTDLPIGTIFPTQTPIINDDEKKPFEISDLKYKSELYESKLIYESEIMKWKGIDNIYIKICPFKYHPLDKLLSVLSEFTLSVKFNTSKSNTGNENINAKQKDLIIFDNKNFMESSMEYLSMRTTQFSNESDYLIIVGDIPAIENSQAMQLFRKWKALKGYKTKMVSTSTIGTDTASIKNYITQQYLLGIKRVLFVGTQEKIPIPTFIARQYQSDHPIVKSDYWYGCTDGAEDIQCNLPIARFVTNTLDDFTNVVNKTIKYESLFHTWANRVLLVAHEQLYPSLQAPLDNIYNAYYQIMDFYKAFAASFSNGGNGSTISDVISIINNGVNFISVNAHGNPQKFFLLNDETSILKYTDTGLLNSETYPVFFDNACSNGDFTNNYSIMNYFMRSNHCCSAWISSSVPSFVYAQNQLTQILYNNLLGNNMWTLGDLLLNSHIANLGYGNTAIDNAFSYIYGGDPSLELWTGNQSCFNNVELSMSENVLDITVSDTYNYNINVVRENGELIGKYNSSNYSISLPLTNGKYDIAICKHNYIPYIIHVDTESSYIQNTTITGNAYFGKPAMLIGNNVTSSIPYGDVVIEPNAKVEIKREQGVTITGGFECKNGGQLIIK